ncbi:MAG: hypothetical protein AB8B65_01860 [Kordia sp.]
MENISPQYLYEFHLREDEMKLIIVKILTVNKGFLEDRNAAKFALIQ